MLTERSRYWLKQSGKILISAVVFLILIAGVIISGWQSGVAVNQKEKMRIWEENVQRQLELAKVDLKQGDERLALQRVNWILEQDEDYVEAILLYDQIQIKLSVSPTVMRATATQVIDADLSEEAVKFAALEKLEERLKWEALIDEVISFQHQHPSYKRWETDRILYQAYIEQGLILIQGDQPELGITYLNQAEKLGDVGEEVNNYRIWGRLYLDGIAFYQVDWGQTINYFSDLCWVAPFYQNSCLILYEAMVAYGDQYGAQLEWCEAADWYREATQVTVTTPDVELRSKIEEAAEACLLATPTAEIISGTVPISGTIPFDGIETEQE